MSGARNIRRWSLICATISAGLAAAPVELTRAQTGAADLAIDHSPSAAFAALPYDPAGPCRRLWREYVAAKSHKAFAITREKKQLTFYLYPSLFDHSCGYAAEAMTPETAVASAIRRCEKWYTNAECVVLAVDARIVWTPNSR